MSYAYIRKAPFDLETHRVVRDQLGPEAPEGLLVHLVFRRGEELEFIDVWDSEQDWERFPAMFRRVPGDEPTRHPSKQRRAGPSSACRGAA